MVAAAPSWRDTPRQVPPLVEVVPGVGKTAKLSMNFHYGQALAWNATERIVAVVAGTQSGKTTFGPLWLRREMQREGPGTYLIAAPTDPLLQVKLIPEFKRLFCEQLGLGTYTDSPRPKFVLSKAGERNLWGREQDEETVVYFGYAAKPDSLESMTVKAAWLDEAGQSEFKVGSWEAIMRRLSLSMGRVLITTTPYTVGHWLRRRIFDKTVKVADGTRVSRTESIRVIQFKSIWNPAFPQAEWRRAKRDLPRWKFKMMYCGEFAKPAGQIYDVFSEVHLIPRTAIAANSKRYVGLDFGGVNTYATFLYERGDGALVAYKTYTAGNRTAKMHVDAMLKSEPIIPVAYGGAKSEQQWRDEFKAAGLLVKAPLVSEVEIGIDRVYAQLAQNRLYVFDDLDDLIDEFDTYSRKSDEEGIVYDEILDKSKFHGLDSMRYIVSSLRGDGRRGGYTRSEPSYDDDDDLVARRDNYYGR